MRSLVRLRVVLPAQTFEAHAMVVHATTSAPGATGATGAPGVGLQFWGLAGPARKTWDEFVQATSRANRGPLVVQTPVHPVQPTSGVRAVSQGGRHGAPFAGAARGSGRRDA